MAHPHRKARVHALAFDAITVEGALIAPAMLARMAALSAADQTPADYGIPKGLAIRDEIARYFRMGQALFAELAAAATPSHRATVDFAQGLLRDVFGFVDITRTDPKQVGDRWHPITFVMVSGRVPVVVVPPQDEFDRPSVALSEDGRRRSAASTMQDWLNAEDASLWGLALNGDRLRLMRDNTSFTRPAFIEADLRHIFQDEAFSDFTALWLLIHASRFGQPGAPITDCSLERWRDAGAREGEVARDRLRDGVEQALLALGNGFLAHPDNVALRARLSDGTLPTAEFFGQLLRLVYRLIFLFAAEDRDLLHMPDATATARKLYAEGYSLGRLRDRAVKLRYRDSYHDQWEGLLIAFSALGRGEPNLGLPALDGLFARDTLPDLEVAHLANRDLMEAIYSLAWLKDASGPVPVNWRDMQTEELGSVYESLLELAPQIANDARKFGFAEGAEAKGNARKTSGSYYTPDSLVQMLLNSALDPVLDRVTAEADDPAKALLSVTVIDPACGSGHFLLAAARRIATRLAKLRAGGLASAEDFRHALRDVVRACIHGVDRNPMAVDLAKVALWIETVDPGKPLGFLDANIRCGDALFGVFHLKAVEQGIPDAAYKPLIGDDKDTAKFLAKRNKEEREGQGTFDFTGGGGKLPPAFPLADAARALRALPEDSPDEIAIKRKSFEAGRTGPLSWNLRIAADLYAAAFLAPKVGGSPSDSNAVTIPTTAQMWNALAGRNLHGPLVRHAQDLSNAARAFHWSLEFPDVMAAEGFDVVLGNPPWDRIKLQEQEFFASRDPEIAEASNAAARVKLIAMLKGAELGTRKRAIYDEFETAKRFAEATSEFARVPKEAAGRFALTGRGDVNTYALFAELFTNLASERGRSGMVIPTGVATDATTAIFFNSLVSQRRLISLHDFQTGLGFFDRIGHARFKFCLLTVGHQGSGPGVIEFSFFSRTIEEFADKRRHFTLSLDDISRINPNTKTAPIFRSSVDAQLTAKIYENSRLLREDHGERKVNDCGAFYLRLVHFGDHKNELTTAAQALERGFERDGDHWRKGENRLLPVWESKLTNSFDLRYASFVSDTDVEVLSDKDAQRQNFRYWVSEKFFNSLMQKYHYERPWFLAYRDVVRSTDERTVIALALPREPASIKLPVLGFDDRLPGEMLLANFNSLPFDYVTRQKIGGISLSFFILKQLPIIGFERYTEDDIFFIRSRLLELSFVDDALMPFARDLGYDGLPFMWNDARRAKLRAELDAWYARAYGLTRDELRYILDPADVMGADYPSETFRVLKKNEIAKYGEYRTARLVLEAWDVMERGETREISPPIEIATPSPAPIELATLPDGAWARLGTLHPGDVGATVTAILKVMVGAKPIRNVRLMAAFVLEPRLLVPLLSKSDASDWRRLVGSEADPLPANVTAFANRVNAGWGAAIQNHRGNGRLIEDPKNNTWAAGPGLDAIDTSGWPERRARFVLDVLTKLDLGTITKSLPSEIQRWIADVAAA